MGRNPGPWLLALALGCGDADCRALQEPGPVPAPERHTLRLRAPAHGETHRLQIVAEAFVPGTGTLRTLARMDVTLTGDAERIRRERTLVSHTLLADGVPVEGTDLSGAVFDDTLDTRMQRVDGEGFAPADDTAPVAARTFAEIVELGLMLRFPEDAVGLGGSWTVEPVSVQVHPLGRATVRPTFTLEAIEGTGAEQTVLVNVDMEIEPAPLRMPGGVTIDGSGTATGNMRVRLRDGLLIESLTEQRITQEVRNEDTSLGYRELATAFHVWRTGTDDTPPLGREPPLLDAPAMPAECELALSSLSERLLKAPRAQPVWFGTSAERVELADARDGRLVRDPGSRLVITADGTMQLDGRPVARGTLKKSLSPAPPVLYVVADRRLAPNALRTLLAPVAKSTEVRLLVHARAGAVGVPEDLAWLDARLTEARALTDPNARRDALRALVFDHLALCEPALGAFRAAITDGNHDTFRDALVPAFLRCGCDTTRLADLEALLYAILGPPDLRALPLTALTPAPDLATSLHDAGPE